MKLKTRLKLMGKVNRLPMTFGRYCLLHSVGAISNHEEIIATAKKPVRLCGRYLPNDLDRITMGQLVDVLEEKNETKTLTILYNVSQSELEAEWAQNVIGAIKWTSEQLESITALLNALNRDFTADEIMAGAEQMKGDIFSTIDWYALRMGITDHDEVLKVPWIKIWRCAKDDREAAEYKQRLTNIKNQKK